MNWKRLSVLKQELLKRKRARKGVTAPFVYKRSTYASVFALYTGNF